MRWQIVMSVLSAACFGFIVWRKIVKEIGAGKVLCEGSCLVGFTRRLDYVVSHLPYATHAFFL